MNRKEMTRELVQICDDCPATTLVVVALLTEMGPMLIDALRKLELKGCSIHQFADHVGMKAMAPILAAANLNMLSKADVDKLRAGPAWTHVHFRRFAEWLDEHMPHINSVISKGGDDAAVAEYFSLKPIQLPDFNLPGSNAPSSNSTH